MTRDRETLFLDEVADCVVSTVLLVRQFGVRPDLRCQSPCWSSRSSRLGLRIPGDLTLAAPYAMLLR